MEQRVRPMSPRLRVQSLLEYIRGNVSPGYRSVLGVLLIIGGVLGFLPILGFWMIPFGVAVAAMVATQGTDILPNVALVMYDGATKFPLLAIDLELHW